MRSYILHFIRNGLTVGNVNGRYIGHTDEPLSAEGEEQIRQMMRELDYPQATAVFSSPLLRCVQTCELIYGRKPVAINEIMEYNFGDFEGKTAEELKDHPVFERWLSGEEGVSPPFGESNEDFSGRICRAFERIVDGIIKTGTQSTAIITHGGVISALLAAYGLPEASMHEWLTPPGCGYTIRIMPQLWMNGKKVEVCAEIPAPEMSFEDEKALFGQ